MTYPRYNIPIDDFHLRVSRGDVAHAFDHFVFGRCDSIDENEAVIWDEGGNFTFLEEAYTLDIVSDSADDALGGTGANTLYICGLDSNYDKQEEVIAMNGLTPVVTANEYIRLLQLMVLTSGTNDPISDANLGTITATITGGATVQGTIQPNNGECLTTLYTVPRGHTAYINGISMSVGQGKQCCFHGKFRNGGTHPYAFSVKFTIDLYEKPYFAILSVPMRVPEKTDIVWTGHTTSGTITATASYAMTIVNDELGNMNYTQRS